MNVFHLVEVELVGHERHATMVLERRAGIIQADALLGELEQLLRADEPVLVRDVDALRLERGLEDSDGLPAPQHHAARGQAE